MPFESQAQRRFMYSQHPELAAEFEKATPKGADLPEHVKKMAEGGLSQVAEDVADAGTPKIDTDDMNKNNFLGDLSETARPTHDSDAVKSYLSSKFNLTATPTEDTTTVKGMADGGISNAEQMEPGVYGETDPGHIKDIVDSLASGMGTGQLAGTGLGALEGLGETGAVSLGKAALQNAPKMEEDLPAAKNGVEVFIKGVQKNAKGEPAMTYWGVKGPKDVLLSEFGDEAPASVPEDVLRAKGYLPQKIDMPTETSPNAYADGGLVNILKAFLGRKDTPILADQSDAAKADAIDPIVQPSTDTAKTMAEGGKVERSSLEHPTANAMMARAMNEGGYPHVTFMENETPEKVKEVTHLAAGPHTETTTTETGEKNNPPHMADGGKTPHFLEGLKKGALHKEMGISEDKKIPAKKLEHAANSDNETLRKRAQFAINAKKWHHAKGGVIPHEEKMKEVYKAMGIKKYADGGEVDASQLLAPIAAPSPSDPTYWDQIKAALSKFSNSPVATAANAMVNPLGAMANALPDAGAAVLKAEVPPIANTASALTGGAIPPAAVSPAVTPPTSSALPPVPPSAALPPTAAPLATPSPSGMPNLGTIFNQDTSKLTAGVNPEDRQTLANKLQEQQHGLGAVIAQAVSGLGDAIAAKGGREQHSLQNIFSMQKIQRDEALANFDTARQDRLQKVAIQTQLGDNALKQAAAADAYGVDDNLNKLVGAPTGTMKKDLPTYFSLMSAQVAKQEKDADLYMKSHAQASYDVDNAVKNASVLGIKPSAAQLQASGAKLADNYYNRAKGNVLIKSSDGQSLWLPAANLAKAKQLDPGLQVQP